MLDPTTLEPNAIRPLRRAEYERLVGLGAFADERVELLGGWLVSMSPQHERHYRVIQRLVERLVPALLGVAEVRVQAPLALSDTSVPEPDIAVVPRGEYLDEHPDVAHVVVEVAHDSLAKDRGVKAVLHAEAKVPEYWIVNLVDGVVEVLSSPDGGAYGDRRVVEPGDALEVLGVRVDVAELIP